MKITIVDHDPAWADEFAAHARTLRNHLGDRALRIDHIGSTAVPGLAAKDIVDMMVTVRDLDDPELRPAVEQAGLRWRTDIARDHQPPGRSVPDAELRKRYAQADRVNCHIREDGRFNQRYALLCRDYLRTHPRAAAAYEAIKLALADRFPDDAEAYYDVKDPVFDLIMEAAYEWADASGWEPGPSDG